MEDDMDRVRRFSVHITYPEYLPHFIVPHARIPRLRNLLVVINSRPTIGVMMLDDLDELEICATMQSCTCFIVDTVSFSSAFVFAFRAISRECSLGQSAQPSLHVHTFRASASRSCVLPARALMHQNSSDFLLPHISSLEGFLSDGRLITSELGLRSS